jgi:glutamate:GABA antiporter
VLLFFEVSVFLYAAKHGVHGLGGHAFLPTYAVFIAVVPVLFFNFAGMEVPSAAGEEMTNPRRDVPFSIAWSGLATVLAYGLPVLSIVLVLPVSQVTGLSGFLDAAKAVFTVYGGHVAASGTATLTGTGLLLGRITGVVFVFALASAGATWIMGVDPGADATFGSNRLLLHGHRMHLENLCGLGQMPATGGWIIVGGARIKDGSGSPATVFGLIP